MNDELVGPADLERLLRRPEMWRPGLQPGPLTLRLHFRGGGSMAWTYAAAQQPGGKEAILRAVSLRETALRQIAPMSVSRLVHDGTLLVRDLPVPGDQVLALVRSAERVTIQPLPLRVTSSYGVLRRITIESGRATAEMGWAPPGPL